MSPAAQEYPGDVPINQLLSLLFARYLAPALAQPPYDWRGALVLFRQERGAWSARLVAIDVGMLRGAILRMPDGILLELLDSKYGCRFPAALGQGPSDWLADLEKELAAQGTAA